MSKTTKKTYTAEDIKQLPFPLCVQVRPQMYIGGNDANAKLTCVQEILNNSVDEHLAGYCDTIIVTRNDTNTFTITDNGRGVPFEKHSSGKNALEVIFGELHAGRNFEDKSVYSTGINGVGGSCVNALSQSFEITSFREGTKGKALFNDGVISNVKTFKKAKNDVKDKGFDKSNTNIEFTFNDKFFEENSEVDSDDLMTLVQETAYLNSNLTIIFEDKIAKVKEKFRYDNGVSQLLSDRVKKSIIPVIEFKSDTINDTRIEVAFTYTDDFSNETITSFCNTINTSEGGTHVTGFKRSISQKLLEYITKNNLTKEKVDNEDIYVGLNSVVSVFVFNPKYTTQTKVKLSNTSVGGHVLQYMNRALDEWLNTEPEEMKAVAKKIELAAKARAAQRRAIESVRKESSRLFSSLGDITKFTDCIENRSGRTELYLCEGDSAGGTVGVARDKNYQALFRLKGKILNVFNMELYKARNNTEVDDLISILRCGAGKDFDIEKLKFDKIIFVCDSDSDGKHIELLLLTFFNEYFPHLIEAGKVYIGVSPLYKASATNRPPVYLNTTEDLAAFFSEQLSSDFNYVNDSGKTLTKKVRDIYIRDLLEYKKKLDRVSEDLNIESSLIERVFLRNYDFDSGGFEFTPNSTVELDVINEESLSVLGFYVDDEGEYFVSVNTEVDTFLEYIDELYQLLLQVADIEVQDKKGNPLVFSTTIDLVNLMDDKVKRTYRITRFKGLGESNPEDLRKTTMQPESRQLIRIMYTHDTDEIVERFMGKNPSGRKEFLKEVFAKTILEME